MINRVAVLLSCAGMLLLPAAPRAQRQDACSVAAVANTARSVECLAVGAIVGAQFDRGRFAVYATEPERDTRSWIWSDEVVQLALASLDYGSHYGFSLDFERGGERKFEPRDVGDLTELARVVQASSHPLVQRLRAAIGPAVLMQMEAAGPGSNAGMKLRNRVSEVLNEALETDVAAMVSANDLRPATARALANNRNLRSSRRLVLEDLLQPLLGRDLKPSYVIRWKPDVAGEAAEVTAHEVLSSVFAGGRSEGVLLAADVTLKAFMTGENLPPNVPFGPTQLTLCSQDFERQQRADTRLAVGVEYVSFFTLSLEYRDSPGLSGEARWFVNPRLIVQSNSTGGGDTPACAARFATSLTTNLPALLRDLGPIGDRLRNLMALLTLNRAIGLLSGLAPVDRDYLRSIPTARLSNLPPKVMSFPIVVAGTTRPVGMAISGGVRLTNDAPEPDMTTGARGDLGPRPALTRPAPFEVTTVVVDGRTLLKIDISSTVGLVKVEP